MSPSFPRLRRFVRSDTGCWQISGEVRDMVARHGPCSLWRRNWRAFDKLTFTSAPATRDGSSLLISSKTRAQPRWVCWIRSSVFVWSWQTDRPRYMHSNRPNLYAMHCDASKITANAKIGGTGISSWNNMNGTALVNASSLLLATARHSCWKLSQELKGK